ELARLQLAEAVVGGRDRVQRLEHAGEQLLLHRRQRDGRLTLGAFAVLVDLRLLFTHAAAGRGLVLARAAGIGGVEIDDVAQQHLVIDQRLAPTDDSAEGERAFADRAD